MGGEEYRRRHERKRYHADVIFSVGERAYSGTLKDISMGGAFVLSMSAAMVARGDLIVISIPYTAGNKSIKRRGRVLWTNPDGFAVAFV